MAKNDGSNSSSSAAWQDKGAKLRAASGSCFRMNHAYADGMANLRYPLVLFLLVACIICWSAISPHDRVTWWLESLPVLIVLPIMVVTARRFPLTPLLYTLVAVHCAVLLVGGHYNYAEVPIGNWLRDAWGTGRNDYDRLGHFLQGFVPAIAGRELLLRTSPLRSGKWMVALIVLSCLGISALYEIIECLAAWRMEQAADAFLGTQGDPWDTQKDMMLAGIGACCALLLLSRIHQSQLTRLSR